MAGAAIDAQETAAHFRAGPVPGIAAHGDLPAAHLGSDVHADVALHVALPPAHALADVLHPRAVAFDANHRVAGVAVDREEITEGGPRVALDDGELGDPRERQASDRVGRDDLGLEGHRGRALEAERDHGSTATVAPRGLAGVCQTSSRASLTKSPMAATRSSAASWPRTSANTVGPPELWPTPAAPRASANPAIARPHSLVYGPP